MAADMAAILNAPFSAIAVASRDWFKAESVFAWTLHLRELSEPTLPEAGHKCTVSVKQVMRT